MSEEPVKKMSLSAGVNPTACSPVVVDIFAECCCIICITELIEDGIVIIQHTKVEVRMRESKLKYSFKFGSTLSAAALNIIGIKQSGTEKRAIAVNRAPVLRVDFEHINCDGIMAARLIEIQSCKTLKPTRGK